MEPIKIYLACHTSCIYESAMYTISTHRTLEGAQKALDDHKNSRFNEHQETYKILYEEDPEYYSERFCAEKVMEYERWEIVEGELLE